ncbi:MAG: dihydroxyacetone kinase subunit DhaL [Bacteroidota bacterium]
MNKISQAQILAWLQKTAELMINNKAYLTELDAAIGDADHGINMERGFKKVLEKIGGFSAMDIGNVLKNTGMTLISSVGGASGPLYGTLYMKMGMALVNKSSLSIQDLHLGLAKGIEGVKSRGKAAQGEKTMIDVLEPVLATLEESAKAQESIANALPKMTNAAKKGMESTTSMVARKGRASYLGARSVGHQDAGATSSYFIFKTLEEAVTQA